MGNLKSYEVAVVGAGPAGLACALALARSGVETVLLAGPHRPAGDVEDQRTAALFGCSIELLRNLEVWPRCAPASEVLRGIRIVDDGDGLLKAPEVTFRASEIGWQEFGYNVPQGPLVDALHGQALNTGPLLRVVETAGVSGVEIGDQHVELTLQEGDVVRAGLVAAADGRNSVCRAAAGIDVSKRSYPQVAVACRFKHTRDHGGISTEFHREAGPCTVVPLPGRASSLVWVERPEVAKRLAEMPLERFVRSLETRLQGLLGSVSDVGARAVFPLSMMSASVMGARRVALVGEAGHVIPPIGAQGLNLSLRDGATLADIVADAKSAGADVGGADVLARYDGARRGDIGARSTAIDIFNRSLISSVLPMQLARGAGLHVLAAVGPLRRQVIRHGLQPVSGLPRLMRGASEGATQESANA